MADLLKQIKVNCKYCGEPFNATMRKNTNKFCSRRCRSKHDHNSKRLEQVGNPGTQTAPTQEIIIPQGLGNDIGGKLLARENYELRNQLIEKNKKILKQITLIDELKDQVRDLKFDCKLEKSNREYKIKKMSNKTKNNEAMLEKAVQLFSAYMTMKAGVKKENDV